MQLLGGYGFWIRPFMPLLYLTGSTPRYPGVYFHQCRIDGYRGMGVYAPNKQSYTPPHPRTSIMTSFLPVLVVSMMDFCVASQSKATFIKGTGSNPPNGDNLTTCVYSVSPCARVYPRTVQQWSQKDLSPEGGNVGSDASL